MDMLKAIGILLVGFVLLIKGADFFVEGSSAVAKKLRIPSMIVGLTIVAIGTSMPELAVSISASLASNNEIAISNVVGSNIFNLLGSTSMSKTDFFMTPFSSIISTLNFNLFAGSP